VPPALSWHRNVSHGSKRFALQRYDPRGFENSRRYYVLLMKS